MKKTLINNGQAAVVRALKQRPKSGLTRRQIEEATGKRSGTVCARVGELIEKGVISRAGKRWDEVTKKSVEVLKIARQ